MAEKDAQVVEDAQVSTPAQPAGEDIQAPNVVNNIHNASQAEATQADAEALVNTNALGETTADDIQANDLPLPGSNPPAEIGQVRGSTLDEFQVMDMLTQYNTSEFYDDLELVKAGYDSQLRSATTYYGQKNYELGLAEYDLAHTKAVMHGKITGFYVSPRDSHMISQERVAQEILNNPSSTAAQVAKAQNIMRLADNHFKDLGISRQGRKTVQRIEFETTQMVRDYEIYIENIKVQDLKDANEEAIDKTIEDAAMTHSKEELYEMYGQYRSEEQIDALHESVIGTITESMYDVPVTAEAASKFNELFQNSKPIQVGKNLFKVTAFRNNQKLVAYYKRTLDGNKYIQDPETKLLEVNYDKIVSSPELYNLTDVSVAKKDAGVYTNASGNKIVIDIPQNELLKDIDKAYEEGKITSQYRDSLISSVSNGHDHKTLRQMLNMQISAGK